MRKLHLTYGWCVDLTADAPSGELIDRRWFGSSRLAGRGVEDVRGRIAHLDAAEALAEPWAIAEPQADLGVIVAHGYRGGLQANAHQLVSIDGDAADFVCRVEWVPAGPHRATWVGGTSRTLVVDALSVTHVSPRWLGIFHQPENRMIPPWHRCPQRSLRFEDGRLRADRPVRDVAQG